MEVKGPQSNIIQINEHKGASISNIINMNGSEGASIRVITKTSFLNVFCHFQRKLLFGHEKSDMKNQTHLRLMEVNGPQSRT